MKWLAAVGAVLAVVGAGYAYWRYDGLHPATDDAYVEANIVHVAAQVSGPVTAVHVRDHEHVRTGQPLFDIDQRPFELNVAQAQARLQIAKQGMGSDVAAVRAAEAEVESRRVVVAKARKHAKRVDDLQAQGFVSTQAGDDAAAALDTAVAELAVAEARLRQARVNLGHSGDQNQRIREVEASLKQSELDLSHTHVVAACDGQLAQLSLQPGSAVRAGNPLFALVCTGTFWVEANFKETQLEHIRHGQPVEIELDMYPGHLFEGRVEDIGRASGSAFSLLPPQNATGNWVKVTQRVPVRIAILKNDSGYPLRVGTSAKVTVDTTGATSSSKISKTKDGH